jgi:cytochrome c553
MHVRLIAAALASAFISTAAHAQVAVKGDPAKAQQLVTTVCAACHGADGNSAIPANPVLAGQHPEYTFKQLTNFKAEAGKNPERPSPVMTAMVANLSRDDMANAALYFGGQEAKPRAARPRARQARPDHLPRRDPQQERRRVRVVPRAERRGHPRPVSPCRGSARAVHE